MHTVPQPLSICLTPGKKDPRNILKTFPTWEELQTFLSPNEYPSKDAVPLWSPCVFSHRETRKQVDLESIHLIVADLDSAPPAEISRNLEALSRAGVAWYLHSSYSHDPEAGLFKFRLIVPLAKPVPAHSWKAFWLRVQAFIPGLDKACKDPGRFYFLPSHPPGKTPVALTSPGRHLELADLPAILPSPKQKANGALVPSLAQEDLDTPGHESPTADLILAYGRQLVRVGGGASQVIGDRLIQLARGHAFASEGEGDTWVYKLTGRLVSRWPNLDPVETARLFTPSLTHRVEEGICATPYPIEEVQAKLERHLEAIKSSQEATQNAEITELGARIWEAFAAVEPGRGAPYTDAELAAMAKIYGSQEPGLTPAQALQHRWILSYGNLHYMLGPAGYRRVCDSDIANKAKILLSPALTAGVEFTRITLQGEKRALGAGELRAAYGMTPDSMVYSVVESGISLQYRNGCSELVIGTAPLADIEARFDPEIDGWLRALAGSNYDALAAWLYWADKLDRPCAALALTGPGGTGKSLLACGIAGLWGRTAGTPLHTVTQWTTGIRDCPLLVAEEKLPNNGKQGKGMDLQWFRDIIQARTHTIQEKRITDTQLRGSVRVVMVLQSPDVIFSSVEDMGQHDIAAVAERVALIPVGEKAREIVEALPPEVKDDWALYKIAQHIKALPPVPADGRFLVKVDSEETQRIIASNAGLAPKICQWLVTTLLAHEFRVDLETTGVAIIQRDGETLVQCYANVIYQSWGSVFMGEQKPALRSIGATLGGVLSKGGMRVNNKRVYLVDPAPLAHFANSIGVECNLLERLNEACKK